jgi:hypothetical protein
MSASAYNYTVAVVHEQLERTDIAIATYLKNHPNSSVDDALDALFQLGINTFLASSPTKTTMIGNEFILQN